MLNDVKITSIYLATIFFKRLTFNQKRIAFELDIHACDNENDVNRLRHFDQLHVILMLALSSSDEFLTF